MTVMPIDQNNIPAGERGIACESAAVAASAHVPATTIEQVVRDASEEDLRSSTPRCRGSMCWPLLARQPKTA